MKSGLFKKKKKMSSDMALQITSMADIFMILLVFLLKNYSASVAAISPSQNTKLPIAVTQAEMKDTLKLEVSPDALLIDEKPVLALKNFIVSEEDKPKLGEQDKLTRALLDERAKHKGKDKDSHLMLIADEKVPYETIQRVLASAAGSGYVDLQLVVVQKE